MDETLSVRIVVGGRADSLKGPDLRDFNVLGKSTGTSISIVNNEVSQKQTIDMTLKPRHPGKLTIGKVDVIVAGRTVASSQPIAIQVSGAAVQRPSNVPVPGAVPSPGKATERRVAPPTEEQDDRQAFLTAVAPQRTLYTGEPIYVEYVLYVRSNIPLQGVRPEGSPDLKGFVVEQSDTSHDRAGGARIKGLAYNTHVQWSGTVTALESGEAVLDPLSLTMYVGDIFSQRRYRMASEPLAIEFEDPPAKGRPADYVDGTVGRFVAVAALDKETVRVGNSGILTVEVSGTGNLRAVKPPVIRNSTGLRVSNIPTTDLDEFVADKGGVSGKRTFQYLLTPEHEGVFEIGRVDLPFFNSISGRYERTRTDPLELKAVGQMPSGPVYEARKEGVTVGIIESSDLAPPLDRDHDTLDMQIIYAGLSIPFAFFLGAEAWRRRRDYIARNHSTLLSRKALRKADQALNRLVRGTAGNPVSLWAGIDAIVRDYLTVRFSIPATGITHDELRSVLRERGAAMEATDALVAELESCAFGRFAPSSAQESDQTASTERIRTCLKELDRAGG